jgi:hypothetical protein
VSADRRVASRLVLARTSALPRHRILRKIDWRIRRSGSPRLRRPSRYLLAQTYTASRIKQEIAKEGGILPLPLFFATSSDTLVT